MSKIEDFKKWKAMNDYVKNTFIKTEDHAALLFRCSTWMIRALTILRESATTGNQQPLPPFPDTEFRNFEELGKEMDRLCAECSEVPIVNEKEKN